MAFDVPLRPQMKCYEKHRLIRDTWECFYLDLEELIYVIWSGIKMSILALESKKANRARETRRVG